MNDVLEIRAKDGADTREQFDGKLWPKIPKICCEDCRKFLEDLIVHKNWICPFCHVRVRSK